MPSSQKTPKLTVLLSVYNGQKYLKEAIKSVLDEPEDFELLVINDGSKDDTKKILDELAKKDSRLRVIHQENAGLTAALNRGIDEARGEYIARMDDDDYTMPGRFSKEMAVLDGDEDVVLVAGGFRIITHDGKPMDEIFPYILSEGLQRRFYLGNAIAHGSVMYRKSAVVEAGKYSSEVGPTEDYDLWSRLISIGKVQALPDIIYTHRANPNGISATGNDRQRAEMVKNVNRLWKTNPPKVMPASKLKKNFEFYKSQTTPGKGQWTWHYLRDNAQIGVKMIKYGHVFGGVWQLINVAMVGSDGLKAIKDRIKAVKVFESLT